MRDGEEEGQVGPTTHARKGCVEQVENEGSDGTNVRQDPRGDASKVDPGRACIISIISTELVNDCARGMHKA